MGATGSGAGIVSALPTTCTACGIPIAPKAEYHLFGRGRVLCDHCLPRRTAHRAVHPECAALEHYPFDHVYATTTRPARGRRPKEESS